MERKTLMLFLVSLGAIFFLLQQWVGFEEVFRVVLRADPVILTVSISIFSLVVVLWGIRWKMLFRELGMDISWRDIYKYLLMGLMFNNITPFFRFGGEPIKNYVVSKDLSLSQEKTFVTISMDSASQLISYIFIAYIAVILLFMANIEVWFELFISLNIMMGSLLFLVYIFTQKNTFDVAVNRIQKIANRLSKSRGRKFPETAKKFRNHVIKIATNRNLFAKALLFSFIERICEILAFFLIFSALGFEIPLFVAVIGIGIGILAGSIPLFPGGLVTYEYFIIFFTTLLGIPLGIATASVLLWRFISYWSITFIGAGISWVSGFRAKGG